MGEHILSSLAYHGVESLYKQDPTLYELLEAEYYRQTNTLVMVASSSIVDPSILACEGMVLVNVTAEGYPGKRYHAGCKFIDEIEKIAIERAKYAFNAMYANVQPHSATTANEVVLATFLKPNDTILGMELQFGGHLTHGSKASISGTYFHAIGYGLDQHGIIDYEQVAELAHQHKPRIIICGATAYPRVIDFSRFRAIADEVNAFLLADISHIGGLVVAGLHPNPINDAHFTTVCTHKQLYGPRGGLILMGRDYDKPAPDGKRSLAEAMQRAVFPFFQGAPLVNAIAAKARALDMVVKPEFKMIAQRIVTDAQVLAQYFMNKNYRVIANGSDNHIVLIDVTTGNNPVTGFIAEKALEECGIIVNKNRIAGDTKPASITSGIRLGTNSLALRRMGPEEINLCGDLVHRVLSSIERINEREYRLLPSVKAQVQEQVHTLCKAFPIVSYPITSE